MEPERGPTIHTYVDGVEWLTAWWRWWREQRRSHTQERFAREARVAAGALPNVLSGRYVPSSDTLKAFNRVLGLGDDELAYLQAMFAVARARTADGRAAALATQQALQREAQSRSRPAVSNAYLNDWENLVIREAARRRTLPAEPARIASALRVPIDTDRVAASVSLLSEAGLLVATEHGLRADRDAVGTGPVVRGVRELHSTALRQAEAAIGAVPWQERELDLLVLSFRRQDLPQVRAQLHAALSALRDLADATAAPDEVYQVGVQVFPVLDLDRVR